MSDDAPFAAESADVTDAGADCQEYRDLPDELAEMLPGPGLSALLATLDPAWFNGWQLVELLAAQQRQVSFEQARLLAVARELAFTPAGPPMQAPLRRTDQDPYVGTEIGFALALTEHAAGVLAELAVCVTDRIPALGEALRQGLLDLPKLRVIAGELGDAEDAHARAVVAALLPEASRCTTTQLRVRLRYLLCRLDPDAVRRRHRRALEARCVQHHEFANGTSSITGVFLPTDKAAAAYQHLDAIAAATKAAGDERHLDQIRADAFADLLAGVDPRLAGAVIPAPRKGVINLQIGLTTLADLQQHPGEIAGFGPVLADIARAAAEQLAATAHWRFTVRDANGDPVTEGPLRRRDVRAIRRVINPGYRPTAEQKAFVQARDGTCRAPGCRRPAHRCDVDHVEDWAHTHDTSIPNLCVLCRRHHRAKHVGGFRIHRGLHGLEWRTPRGQRYTVIGDQASPPSEFERDLDAYVHGHRTPRLRR